MGSGAPTFVRIYLEDLSCVLLLADPDFAM